MKRAIRSVIYNNSGLEMTMFNRFYLSEKSVNLQANGVVSFFVNENFDKVTIKDVINKISDSDNCVSVRTLNVRPRAHTSRKKRGAVNYKIKGETVNKKWKKVFVTLRDVSGFIGRLNK